MSVTFVLPELGENIESGTVTAVLVSVGDTVTKDQTVVELETDKAVLDVPSPETGTVIEINVKEGDTLRVGDVVLVVDESGATAAPEPEPKVAEASSEPAPQALEETGPEPIDESPDAEAVPAPEPSAPATSAPSPPARTSAPKENKKPKRAVRAAPSVRRFARELGVDIHEVTTVEPSGRVTIADVKAFVKHQRSRTAATTGGTTGERRSSATPLPDFTKWGRVEREPMSNVRMATARQMAAAWSTIPHVTQHDKADTTELEKFRKEYGHRAQENGGGKLTPTAILVKVLASALKESPEFNVSIDMEKKEIIKKHYCNIAVAVDTDRGLLVPVIQGVDTKSITEISAELNAMAERARNRKTKLDELQGACITITNLGGIGGTAFTPIVNPPEVAILGVSRSSMEPVYKDGEFVPRLMMPMSLSYDHRVIDGANAARFLRWICVAVEQPFLLLLDN